jgi:hypothetical protein
MPAAPAAPKEKAKTEEPQTSAARRQAGLPEQADPQAADAAAGQVEPTQGESQRVVTTVPGGEEVTADNMTEEERDLIRRLRSDRGREVREKIAESPVGLGTHADPYALVHASGCPHPENTETYEAERPNGVKVTVHRCIQCGAQNNIDH